MNTSFGAAVPSTNFNIFQDNKIPHFLTDAPSSNPNKQGRQMPTSYNAFQKPLKTPQHNQTKSSSRLKKSEGKSNAISRNLDTSESSVVIGPLISNPEQFGFENVRHKSREMPRFLIGQQPQLKQKKFNQDPWDKANQKKMLQLEDSIEDVTELYETLKKMRDMERKVMENKGLVDKADLAKDLTDAISFQGTCLDMCPVFERARRNVEHTVFSYEKDDPDQKKASRGKALKVFSRPAAAAAPPLPSDVRPPHVLCQTLDYIVENLLDTLPDSEGFLWDRMRSIRQDFTYQNYSGPEAVNCNERIVRIHLLIIHIMGKCKVEFSLQQELEQLHKSLITLSEIYDEVRAVGGECPNEAEFRAYALLSKIRDPEYDKNIQELPPNIFQDDLVQIALCFRRIISNSNFNSRGYIKTENCLNFYQRFFQLMRSKKIPFLLSSFLELYVNDIRFYGIKALSHSLNKKHKAITYEHLIDEFLFNDQQDLEEFCRYYSIALSEEGVELKSLVHHSHRLSEKQPLKQAHLKCVDEMLSNVTISNLINATRGESFITPSTFSKTTKKTTQFGFGSNTSQDTEIKDPFRKPQPQIMFDKKHPFQQGSQQLDQNLHILKNTAPNADDKTPTNSAWQATGSKFQGTPSLSLPSMDDNLFARQGTTPDKVKEQAKVEEETQRKLQEAQIQERERLKAQRQKSKVAAASELTNSLIKEVVHEQVSGAVHNALKKENKRKYEIEKLSQNLYQAFLHEKLYTIYLESNADIFEEKRLKSHAWSKWKSAVKSLVEKRETEKKRKFEIRNVGRQLGVPHYKKSKLLATPRSDGTSSFVLSSPARKDMAFSPVTDEVNKFSTQQEKKIEIWEPLQIKEVYLDELSEKVRHTENIHKATIFLYGNNWSSIPNSWVMKKFGITDRNRPIDLQDDHLNLNISCIDSNYDPSTFNDVQLLVFNTGVTDSNIFDLEMKLQQDGEELIKLVTGISLNTNICFSLIILYWESAETPLTDSVIFKCLKLNRISRSFGSVIQDIKVINITGNSPHKELEKGLVQIVKSYKFKLTDRGRYHVSLQKQRSLAGIPSQKAPPDTSKNFDDKMKRMLELELNKGRNKTDIDGKNTYAHLKYHIGASPRADKRKLPVLLSKSKENKFKTPLAIRSLSSSSPGMPSHLATKIRRDPHSTRYQRFLPPGTPSHSTNIPQTSTAANTSLAVNARDSSLDSHLSFDSSTIIREPALFRTPVNSTRSASSAAAAEPTNHPDIPENLLELKALIESVKKKVNNN